MPQEPVQKDELTLLAEKYEKQEWQLLESQEQILRSRVEVFLQFFSVIASVGIFYLMWWVWFPTFSGGWNNGLTAIPFLLSIGLLLGEPFVFMSAYSMASTYASYRRRLKQLKQLQKTQKQRMEFLRTYELTKADPDFKAALASLTRNRND